MLRNLLALIILVGLIYISFNSERATSVEKKKEDQFSAEATLPYLKRIASKVHPIGSLENMKVRDYLYNTLRNEGLEVRLESGYINSSWKPTYMQMAYVENIVAVLKGSDPKAKKVLIAAHYDSVFEGPGAADDGYAVACMIETAKMLKDIPRKNDIIFLITDGEEMGLLGAKYHAENNDLSDIGIMLNFEARGNEGPGIAFEFSDNNGWLVSEMAKVSKRPIANSLSFEIYKRMPNATDYTVFKNKGVPGVNYAFIDGFSYYHNPADNIENLSMESVQHTGENMYLMAKHFANYDFVETAEGNASFFNFYGNLIHYSSSLDLFILMLVLLLLGFTFYRLFKAKEVTVKAILLGFLSLFGILILVGGLNYGLAELIKKFYPDYSTFYISHYYNHEWYFLAGVGLTLAICWLVGSRVVSKFGNKNIGLSTALLLALLSLVLFAFVPTGTYLMMYPLSALTVGILLSHLLKIEEKNWQSLLLALGMLSVFVGMWTPFSHSLFLGFSFAALPAAVLPAAWISFAGMALLPGLWKKNDYLVLIVGICLFSYALINAHQRSKPSEKEPLNSNLFFVTDLEAGESYWASTDHNINEGHLTLLDGCEEGRLPRHLPFSRLKKKSILSAESMSSFYTIDTIPDTKTVRIKVRNPQRAGRAYMIVDEVENIDSISINGQLNSAFEEGATGQFYTALYGIGLDSMTVEIGKRDIGTGAKVRFNIQYQETFMTEDLPDEIVRSNGYTMVSEVVEF